MGWERKRKGNGRKGKVEGKEEMKKGGESGTGEDNNNNNNNQDDMYSAVIMAKPLRRVSFDESLLPGKQRSRALSLKCSLKEKFVLTSATPGITA